MAWTPPAAKWKTQRSQLESCECVLRERFDALAEPRIKVVAGFENLCADHTDPAQPVPVGLIETFLGEWMTFDEWHAYEACFYSWVVWHEIDERHQLALARGDWNAAQDAIAGKAKQQERSRERAAGIPNLDRVTTDEGPWKPIEAIRTTNPAERAAVATVSGWARRDSSLLATTLSERAQRLGLEPGDDSAPAWWFEGSAGDRVLHVDNSNTDRATSEAVAAAATLRYGAGRLVWERA